LVRSYLATGVRQLVAQRLYSAINIVGLAIGLASVVLISLYVRYELSYDAFFPNADRIFRISRDYYAREGAPDRVPASNNAPVAPALLEDFPEIERVARVFGSEVLIRRGEAAYYEAHFRWADPALLDIFSLDWLAGDPRTALSRPDSIVLTESLARRYFGAENAFGATMTLDNQTDVTVTGVVRDLPGNTHLDFEALAPLEGIARGGDMRVLEQWNSNTDFHTYLELREGAKIGEVESRIPDFMTRRFDPEMSAASGMTIMNVRDIHVRSTRDEEWKPPTSLATIYSSATIAALILLIACINFVNLATARGAKRAREVGVRKSLGASRAQLIGQFVGESVAMAAIAMLVATVIVELALPPFRAFVGADLTLGYFGPGGAAPWLALLASAVGVSAGIYPAFYLSAFSSAKVLKGDVSRGIAGARFRNVLVTAQFAIAIVLFICTAVVYEQTRFARDLDLGFDKDRVLVLGSSLRTAGMRRQWGALKAELERVPGVVSVTASHYTPFSWDDNRLSARRAGTETTSRIQFMAVDYGFFETYRIEVLHGRGFSPSFASDVLVAPTADGPRADAGGFVLNESAARLLGFEPESAPGQSLEILAGPLIAPGPVVGVVRDTYFESVAVPLRPMIYLLGAEPRGAFYNFIDMVSVRVDGSDLRRTLAGIDAAWSNALPNEPIVRHFLDDDFDAQYRSEQRQMQLFTAFAALAIFVACLGLLGLACYSTERRTKEIGIRKALGGTVWDVVRLFTTEFSKLVLLANLVSWPLAYLAMQRWLAGFAYRIDLGPIVFAGSALIALAVALLTVGAVAARAASAKPLNSLRYE
jgi:putative ABC transport system permease protein